MLINANNVTPHPIPLIFSHLCTCAVSGCSDNPHNKFSNARSDIAVRVSIVADPRCGKIKQLSVSLTSGSSIDNGSGSVTSNPAANIWLSFACIASSKSFWLIMAPLAEFTIITFLLSLLLLELIIAKLFALIRCRVDSVNAQHIQITSASSIILSIVSVYSVLNPTSSLLPLFLFPKSNSWAREIESAISVNTRSFSSLRVLPVYNSFLNPNGINLIAVAVPILPSPTIPSVLPPNSTPASHIGDQSFH
ncbi:hypothetical protein AX774_g1628 [Zancudomyces culisetae]|uniref:Uncharacterized protein n=1 Tax=Zancudomyces culisetae TaxID=1213189 RepID=A0A1R1PV42_ZANCU|nr:hypothetical protein AX774_g1628 [Zancudomyces culisetae]|eukprot:OMH84837.1 hypothetical protein AX774_g1628 [Zancudomyces culisetae]